MNRIKYFPKPKLCKYPECGEQFVNLNSFKKEYCSYACEAKHSNELAIDEKVKGYAENLKDHQYWVKVLQVVFNTYIRKRDKGKDCISCDVKLGEKYHAGHYLSTGAYPNLRFEETNVNGQCVKCNMHLSGNLIGYTERLPKRIGIEAYTELLEKRKIERKYTIPELKEMIIYYRNKLK